jgi:hypothetical protein
MTVEDQDTAENNDKNVIVVRLRDEFERETNVRRDETHTDQPNKGMRIIIHHTVGVGTALQAFLFTDVLRLHLSPPLVNDSLKSAPS